MSDIRFNRWLHQSGTGGVSQDSSGNIGIGTTVPTKALDVVGDVKIGDTISIENTSGIITATTFRGVSADFSGNVSIAGTLTYEDVTNIDSVGVVTARSDVHIGAGLSVVGVSTLGNTIVGGATTELIVGGDARITGILTIGTSSLTLDGTNNLITVGSGVTINGNTGIISATGGLNAKLLGTPELAAIDSSITDTAVDVFVYDTRKDSDGGAWRKRTQHTSWYNETLNTVIRGSRREFPAVAVITVIGGTVGSYGSDNGNFKINIYDGDDPDLPLWMEFNGYSNSDSVLRGGANYPLTSVYALNGSLYFARDGGYGIGLVSFIDEKIYSYWDTQGYTIYNGNISQRNSNSSAGGYNGTGIVNATVNDVAMTVLPNAPIDDATGLPVPTIAVATDGGASVIKDDGNVYDDTDTTALGSVDFNDDYRIISTRKATGSTAARFFISKRIDTVSSDSAWLYEYYTGNFASGYPRLRSEDTGAGITLGLKGDTSVRGSNIGFTLWDVNSNQIGPNAYSTNSLLCGISTDYNTGWMHGDIKGAFLSDTDATNITDANLITNGTFDTDITGWTDPDNITSVSSGQLTLTSASGNQRIYQSFTVVPGKSYYFSIGTVSGNANYYVSTNTVSSGSLTNVNGSVFTVPSGETTVSVVLYVIGTGNTATFDNVVVKLADPDRSVNNQATNNNGKGLGVFGTVTKSAVATGAELVGYSDWSSSNYLEQPYNSDLNYGTGDFYFGGWFKNAGYSDALIGRLHDSSSAGKGFLLSVSSSGGGGTLVFAIYTLGFQSSGRTTVGTTTNETGKGWQQVWGIRRGGTMELWLNGNLVTTGSNTADISDTTYNPPLFIGVQHGSSVFDGELALMRTGASAPSAEQIKKIYEDEKVLFQENAACTLHGSSDAVTALAYDDSTNLLYAGTSSGRSDFQGLRRINNTTTAVTTAISASNGLVAEQ